MASLGLPEALWLRREWTITKALCYWGKRDEQPLFLNPTHLHPPLPAHSHPHIRTIACWCEKTARLRLPVSPTKENSLGSKITPMERIQAEVPAPVIVHVNSASLGCRISQSSEFLFCCMLDCFSSDFSSYLI